MLRNYDEKYEAFTNVKYKYLDYLFGNYVKSYYIYREMRHNFSVRFHHSSHLHENRFKARLEEVYKSNHMFGRRIYSKQIDGKYSAHIDNYTILMPYNL